MDIENLETFIEVAETRSFSQSAKTLSLTQPAVSKRIASLESSLSTKLFDRIGRTVHLTEAGQILLPSAKQIRSELARIEDVICNIGRAVNGKLTIGTTECTATRQLPSLLRSYRLEYPDVKMDLQFDTAEEILKGVEQHQFELALCPLTDATKSRLSNRLATTDVWETELRIAVANSDSLTSEVDLTLEALVQNPAILTPQSTFIRRMLDSVLASRDLRPNPLLETKDHTTIRSMTSVGLGWTCLPLLQLDDTLTTLEIDDLDLKYTVAVVYRNDLTLSRAAQMFIDTLSSTHSPDYALASPHLMAKQAQEVSPV